MSKTVVRLLGGRHFVPQAPPVVLSHFASFLKVVSIFWLAFWPISSASEPWSVQLSFSSGTARDVAAAQSAVFETFFDRPYDGANDVALFGLSDQGQPLSVVSGSHIALSLGRPIWRSGPTSLHGAAVAGYGTQSFRLPDGIGVFVDPAEVDLRSWSLAAEMELRKTLSPIGIIPPVELRLALGATRSWYAVRVTSALLDVRAEGVNTVTYARSGFSTPLFGEDSGLWQYISLTRYGNTAMDVQLGIDARF
ncbi:MAG: hypothetical protein MK098_08625 [Marinovum sp.]|nr:hypothetical protein [Marinovum sp.]